MPKFVGTDGYDSYRLEPGERNVVQMLGGDDLVAFNSASLDSDDRLDGGTGRDTAVLDGGGFYNIGHNHFLGFETLYLIDEGRFEVYIDDSVVPASETLSVNARIVPRGSSIFIDGQAERDGSLVVHATGGDDVLIGTGRADAFYGSRGDDLMTGNEGADTFDFLSNVRRGDIWGIDRITDFQPGEDHLVLHTDTVTSFDQLLLDRTREGVVIRTPDSKSSITLLGVLPRDLHASDVTFEPLVAHVPAHALTIPHDGHVLA